MKTASKLVIGALIAAFTLAACGEAPSDIARKPDLVVNVVTNSLKKCDLTEPAQRDSSYEYRLRTVLNDTQSQTLDMFLNNDITICLDSRMPDQSASFFNTTIIGTYNNDGKTPTVSLYDNGMVGKGRGFFTTNTSDYGYEMLDYFAKAVNGGSWLSQPEINLSVSHALAGRYSCGKSCITTRWYEGRDYDQDSIFQNPALLVAPLRP